MTVRLFLRCKVNIIVMKKGMMYTMTTTMLIKMVVAVMAMVDGNCQGGFMRGHKLSSLDDDN